VLGVLMKRSSNRKKGLGGIKMEKKKLLTVMVFCLIASLAMADDVISIDLNGYNDANAYSGEAAVPGATVWRAFSTGWGKAMGSPRAVGLPDYNEPNTAAIFATQVWIADPGTDHDWVPGSELMDDGFDANGVTDPDIKLIALGWTIEGSAPGAGGSPLDQGAFGGTFDIYVYGSGNFTLESPIYGPTTKEATGGFSGTFTENVNYVVFTGVLVDDSNEVSITYDGTINGLQLVKAKSPFDLTSSGGDLDAINYDVARDTNRRMGGGTSRFGPDLGDGTAVSFLDGGEWMEYDVNVAPADAGRYSVYALLNTVNGTTGTDFVVSVNGVEYGNLFTDTQQEVINTTSVSDMRFFKGINTFKWQVSAERGYNINSFHFAYVGPLDMNCPLVDLHGFDYAGDFNKDCIVDANDLAGIVDNWVSCYSPDANDCD
jgi:hypothetical protein